MNLSFSCLFFIIVWGFMSNKRCPQQALTYWSDQNHRLYWFKERKGGKKTELTLPQVTSPWKCWIDLFRQLFDFSLSFFLKLFCFVFLNKGIEKRTEKGSLFFFFFKASWRIGTAAYGLAESFIFIYLIYEDRREMLLAKGFFYQKDLQAESKWLHTNTDSQIWVG